MTGYYKMNKAKRKRLEAAGWVVGDIKQLLDLTDEDVSFIEVRLALASRVKVVRAKRRWTQVKLAKALGSSQSRVAKIEKGDNTVTMDLMIRSLFVLGETKKNVARVLQTA